DKSAGSFCSHTMHERKLNTMQQITFLDFLSQETKRDPVAFAARLQEQGPLIQLPALPGIGGAWLVTTYDDAIAVLKDPRFIKDVQKLSLPESGQEAPGESASMIHRFLTFRRDMLTVDPPDHTRLRNLVSKAFTPRMIEQLRPRIQQIADQLLNAVLVRGSMDLIADFAFPLPITVISEMLGIPSADRSQFRGWTQAIVNAPVEPQMESKLATLSEFV